jgi:hypothetical protein
MKFLLCYFELIPNLSKFTVSFSQFPLPLLCILFSFHFLLHELQHNSIRPFIPFWTNPVEVIALLFFFLQIKQPISNSC